MRLFQHPEFDQAVIRAAEHFRPRGIIPVDGTQVSFPIPDASHLPARRVNGEGQAIRHCCRA
jgi:hypothetical protein